MKASQWAYRGLGVGDAQEFVDHAFFRTTDFTGAELDGRLG
ncbi:MULTISPECIES: hypothetical protein [Nitrospirillum]|nr:hypothetical protein [Nitrospirillum amazonense]MEC4591714.1 hypothetical protein [Nitrospirillum amazonense]